MLPVVYINYIRRDNNMSKVLNILFKKAVALVISFGISLGLLSSFAADTDLSFRSLVVREGLRAVVQTVDREGGGAIFGKMAGKISTIPSVYIPSPGYKYEKVQLENCTAEVLTKKNSKNSNKVVFQIHGGAFLFGMMDLYRWQAEKWSRYCDGATVVMIDYRLAPETVFPGALEDVLDCWDWMMESGYKADDVIVVGDSAGGNLTLELILNLRDAKRELPCAAITMSPWADLASESESYKTNVHKDPMFGYRESVDKELDVEDIVRIYAGDADLHDPKLSPMYAEFDGFCPTLIQVGTAEVLYSESLTVAEKMEKAGVDVTLTEYSGMWHVFQLFGDFLPEGKAAWDEAGAYAAEHLLG